MSSPLTFDASIVQIFVALLAKAKLVVVPGDVIQQPGKLCKILFERNQTTILQVCFHVLVPYVYTRRNQSFDPAVECHANFSGD